MVAPRLHNISMIQALSLDGTWKFKTDPYGRGESLAWFAEDLNDQGGIHCLFRKLGLPAE